MQGTTKIHKYTRLFIYSYLNSMELFTKISKLSKEERNIIAESQIIGDKILAINLSLELDINDFPYYIFSFATHLKFTIKD